MQPVSNKYPVRRLLIMVEWFSPGYRAGGPIQSCINICSVLQDQYDIFVLTTDTDHGMIQPYPGIEAGKWLRHPQLNVRVYYMRRKGLKAVEIATVIQQLQPDLSPQSYNKDWTVLFATYPSLTAKEFSELTQIDRTEAENLLEELTGGGKLKKLVTKNGSLWTLKEY